MTKRRETTLTKVAMPTLPEDVLERVAKASRTTRTGKQVV